jgi:MFS family permease
VVVLCLVQLVDVLGVTSATTAIPAIVRGLGADASAAGPLATTYALLFGGLLIVGARLGDRWGHRRVLCAGLIAFLAVSAVGGLADSLAQVLAARALQGASAALSVPSALRLLVHATPRKGERRTALAAWSAAGAAAGAAGFVVGGVLVETWSWHAVFWVNAPVGAALLVAVLTTVDDAPREASTGSLDLPGAVLLVATVMLAVAGASRVEQGGGAVQGAGMVAGAVGAGAAFTWRMRRAVDPLIPPAALRSVNLRHGTVLSFVTTATTSSSGVVATLVLQEAVGLSASLAGTTLLAISVLVVVGSAAARFLLDRAPVRRVAALGIGVIAVGNLVLVVAGGGWAGIGAGVAVLGLGLGIASVAATTLGTTVPPSLVGSASGILNTGAQLGTALGTAVVLLVAAVGPSRWGWLAAGTVAAVAALWASSRWAGDPATAPSAG